MPYAIEKITTGERVRHFRTKPKSLEVTIDGHNRRIVSPVEVGDEGLGYRLIQIDEIDFVPPSPFHHRGEDVETREGDVVTITRQWTPWSQAEIDAAETAQKQQLANRFDDVDDPTRIAVLALQQELNRTNRVIEALGLAIVQGSSLADIKNRVQNLAEKPRETTPGQLKTVIEEILGL